MSEAELESYLVEYAQARDCLALKLVLKGARGFPDRTIIRPDGEVIFIELKTETGSLSRQQMKWLAELESRGLKALVVRTREEVQEVIDGKGGQAKTRRRAPSGRVRRGE